MKRARLNDQARELCTRNTESLYNWWKDTKLPIKKFIKMNKDHLDEFIQVMDPYKN